MTSSQRGESKAKTRRDRAVSGRKINPLEVLEEKDEILLHKVGKMNVNKKLELSSRKFDELTKKEQKIVKLIEPVEKVKSVLPLVKKALTISDLTPDQKLEILHKPPKELLKWEKKMKLELVAEKLAKQDFIEPDIVVPRPNQIARMKKDIEKTDEELLAAVKSTSKENISARFRKQIDAGHLMGDNAYDPEFPDLTPMSTKESMEQIVEHIKKVNDKKSRSGQKASILNKMWDVSKARDKEISRRRTHKIEELKQDEEIENQKIWMSKLDVMNDKKMKRIALINELQAKHDADHFKLYNSKSGSSYKRDQIEFEILKVEQKLHRDIKKIGDLKGNAPRAGHREHPNARRKRLALEKKQEKSENDKVKQRDKVQAAYEQRQAKKNIILEMYHIPKKDFVKIENHITEDLPVVVNDAKSFLRIFKQRSTCFVETESAPTIVIEYLMKHFTDILKGMQIGMYLMPYINYIHDLCTLRSVQKLGLSTMAIFSVVARDAGIVNTENFMLSTIGEDGLDKLFHLAKSRGVSLTNTFVNEYAQKTDHRVDTDSGFWVDTRYKRDANGFYLRDANNRRIPVDDIKVEGDSIIIPNHVDVHTESLSDALTTLLNGLMMIVHSEICEVIRDLFLKLASFHLFKKDIATSLFACFGKPGKLTMLSLFEEVFRQVIKLVKYGEAMLRGVSPLAVMCTGDQYSKYVNDCQLAHHYSTKVYTGLPIPHHVRLEDHVVETERLYNDGKLMIKELPVRSDQIKEIRKLHLQMHTLMVDAKSKLENRFRVPPLLIVVLGNPGVGKSQVMHFIADLYASVLGIKFTDSMMYTKVPGTEFYDGLNPFSMPFGKFTEVGNEKQDYAMRIDPPHIEILRHCDSAPYLMNYSGVEDKGKHYSMFKLIFIDSNKDTLNIDKYYDNEAAFWRRAICVRVSVREKYVKEGSCAIDIDKSLTDTTDRLYDRWNFELWKNTPKDSRFSRRDHLMHGMEGEGIEQLATHLHEIFVKHITDQERINERLHMVGEDANTYARLRKDMNVILDDPKIREIHRRLHYTLFANVLNELLERVTFGVVSEHYTYSTRMEGGKRCYYKTDTIYQYPVSFEEYINHETGTLEVGTTSLLERSFFFGRNRYNKLRNMSVGDIFSRHTWMPYDGVWIAANSAANMFPTLFSWFDTIWTLCISLFCICLGHYVSGMFGTRGLPWRLHWYDLITGSAALIYYYIFPFGQLTTLYFAGCSILARMGLLGFCTTMYTATYFRDIYWNGYRLMLRVVGFDVTVKPFARVYDVYQRHMEKIRFGTKCVIALILTYKASNVLYGWFKQDEENKFTEREGVSHGYVNEDVAFEKHSNFVVKGVRDHELNSIEERIGCGDTYYKIPVKDDFVWNTQQVQVSPTIYKGKAEDLVTLAVGNSRQCVVRTEFAQGTTYILGVKGSMALINTHAIYDFVKFAQPIMLGISRNSKLTDDNGSRVKMYLSDKNVVHLGNDVSLIHVEGMLFRDITKHFTLDDIKEGHFKCCTYQQNTYGTRVDDMIVLDKASNSEVHLTSPWKVSWPGHKPGLCGIPWIVQKTLEGACIMGIHVAGDKRDDTCYFTPVFRDRLEDAIQRLGALYPLLDLVSDSFVTESLLLPKPKSPFRHERLHRLDYYGSTHERVEINQKSSIKRTLFCNEIRKFFQEQLNYVPSVQYAQPMMAPTIVNGEYISPYNIAMRSMVNSAPLRLDISEKVAKFLIAHIVCKLKENGVEYLKPLTVEDAINGVKHDEHIRRMNASTSAGYGYSGSKDKYIPIVDDEAMREPIEEVRDKITECLNKLENGEIMISYFKGALKDEPRDIKKCLTGKTRVFYVAQLHYLVIMRMMLAPFYSLFTKFGDIFHSAVGINMFSQAHRIVELLKFSDLMMEGDYQTYDLRIPFLIRRIVATIIYEVCKIMGYSESALKILRSLLTGKLFPLVVILGEIFRATGITTSGDYGTAEDNSLAGLVLILYAYFVLVGGSDPFLDLLLKIYGDDLLVAVKKRIAHLFNNITYQKFCAEEFDLVYTPASKEAEMLEFQPFDKCSFLKRTFRYREDIEEWVAPLSIDSLYKSLTWTMPSSVVSSYDQMKGMLTSNLWEMALRYDEQKFEVIKKFYEEMFAKYYCNGGYVVLPSYYDILGRIFPENEIIGGTPDVFVV